MPKTYTIPGVIVLGIAVLIFAAGFLLGFMTEQSGAVSVERLYCPVDGED